MELDTDSEIGELYYTNSKFEFGAAVKINNWIFALERMTAEARLELTPNNDPNVWVIAGFHEKSHYSFAAIEDIANKNELNTAFLTYIIERFWSIFHIELFLPYIEAHKHDKKDLKIKWEIVWNDDMK